MPAGLINKNRPPPQCSGAWWRVLRTQETDSGPSVRKSSGKHRRGQLISVVEPFLCLLFLGGWWWALCAGNVGWKILF